MNASDSVCLTCYNARWLFDGLGTRQCPSCVSVVATTITDGTAQQPAQPGSDHRDAGCSEIYSATVPAALWKPAQPGSGEVPANCPKCGLYSPCMCDFDRLQRELTTAQQRIADQGALLERCIRFARWHEAGCGKFTDDNHYDDSRKCTCGLDQLLRDVAAMKGDGGE